MDLRSLTVQPSSFYWCKTEYRALRGRPHRPVVLQKIHVCFPTAEEASENWLPTLLPWESFSILAIQWAKIWEQPPLHTHTQQWNERLCLKVKPVKILVGLQVFIITFSTWVLSAWLLSLPGEVAAAANFLSHSGLQTGNYQWPWYAGQQLVLVWPWSSNPQSLSSLHLPYRGPSQNICESMFSVSLVMTALTPVPWDIRCVGCRVLC
jgi:hypothetical protein